jgi:hypothetical protein
MKIAIRGFAGRTLKFEDIVEVDENDQDFLGRLAEKHAAEMVAHTLHMIEIEFLDEPGPNERFFRFGTDPSGMVVPVGIPLTGEHERQN